MRTTLTCITAIIFLFFAVRVVGADNQGVSVNPTFQEVILHTQDTATSAAVLVKNNSQLPQAVKLNTVDFQQVDINGNIQLNERPQSNTDFTLARYITFADNEAIIQPGSEHVFIGQITNDAQLSPGTHYAAAILTFADVQSESSSQVVPAVSSLIVLKKTGGELYRMSVISTLGVPHQVSLSLPTEFELIFENQGNTHDTPRGTVELRGLFNRLIKKAIINESSLIVLPENRRVIRASAYQVSQPLPFDFISYTITGKSQAGGIQYSQSGTFVYVNPFALLILLLVITSSIYWKVHARGTQN